ncbi:hypothetical protein MICRO8M_70385 [Microbacterium sp. 8M]|nr:hypothetical protein MICRO8M_70385 [Microbacterium sp. 8M]
MLGAHVLDEPAQPRLQRGPGLEVRHLVGGIRERGDLAQVQRLDEVVPRREVAVQRSDADAGATGDVLQGCPGSVLGERLPARGDEGVEVPRRVGTARPPLLQRGRRAVLTAHRAVPSRKVSGTSCEAEAPSVNLNPEAPSVRRSPPTLPLFSRLRKGTHVPLIHFDPGRHRRGGLLHRTSAEPRHPPRPPGAGRVRRHRRRGQLDDDRLAHRRRRRHSHPRPRRGPARPPHHVPGHARRHRGRRRARRRRAVPRGAHRRPRAAGHRRRPVPAGLRAAPRRPPPRARDRGDRHRERRHRHRRSRGHRARGPARRPRGLARHVRGAVPGRRARRIPHPHRGPRHRGARAGPRQHALLRAAVAVAGGAARAAQHRRTLGLDLACRARTLRGRRPRLRGLDRVRAARRRASRRPAAARLSGDLAGERRLAADRRRGVRVLGLPAAVPRARLRGGRHRALRPGCRPHAGAHAHRHERDRLRDGRPEPSALPAHAARDRRGPDGRVRGRRRARALRTMAARPRRRRLRHRLRARLRGLGGDRRAERAGPGHRGRDGREREPAHDRIRDRIRRDRRHRVRLLRARHGLRLRRRLGAGRGQHAAGRRDRVGRAHAQGSGDHWLHGRPGARRRGLNRGARDPG